MKTIVVCGLERGGTSMVAGLLHKLGIPMGHNLEATYEDFDILRAVNDVVLTEDQEALNKLEALLKARSREMPVFGFKVPNIFAYPAIISAIPNALLICVFRDPIAIAESMQIHSKLQRQHSVSRAFALSAKLMEFFLDTKRPSVGISYEKSLSDPLRCIETLVNFLALSPTDQQKKDAIAFVRNQPLPYSKVASSKGIIGQIDRVRMGRIDGWVVDLNAPEITVQVDIQIDGVRCADTICGVERPDLWQYSPKHQALPCGFSAKIPRTAIDNKGHTVTVADRKTQAIIYASKVGEIIVPTVCGDFEGLLDGKAIGWVASLINTRKSISLILIVDGLYYASTTAQVPRSDCRQQGFNDACAFAFKLDPKLWDGATHSFEVRLEGEGLATIENAQRYITLPKHTLERL